MFSYEDENKPVCRKCKKEKYTPKVVKTQGGPVILFENGNETKLTYKAFHNKAFDL